MTRTKKSGKVIWGHKDLPDTFGTAPGTQDAEVMEDWRRQQEVIRAEEAESIPKRRRPRRSPRAHSKRAKNPQ